MASRIERLERLDGLRKMGALSDAEYEREKAKVLNPTSEAITASLQGGQYEDKIEGVKASSLSNINLDGWLAVPLHLKKTFVLFAVIAVMLIVGLIFRLFLATGIVIIFSSVIAVHLYNRLSDEQKLSEASTIRLWKALFCFGCGVVALSVFAGGREHTTETARTEVAERQGLEENAFSSEDEDSSSLSSPKAVLTCRGGGSIKMPVSACFAASHDQGDGRLKISTGGKTIQFADADIMLRLGGQIAVIPLTKPFEISAQANGDDTFVLHIEITSGSRIVFQDEASAFGFIHVSSDSIN